MIIRDGTNIVPSLNGPLQDALRKNGVGENETGLEQEPAKQTAELKVKQKEAREAKWKKTV